MFLRFAISKIITILSLFIANCNTVYNINYKLIILVTIKDNHEITDTQMKADKIQLSPVSKHH